MARSDIPFDANDAHTLLPWVVGIMAAIATLLLCFGVTLNSWVINRHDSYTGNFTVNIPASDDAATKAADVRAELQKLPDVTSISQLSDATLHDMLKPWLGSGDAAEALPLPVVLDVTVKPAATIDYKALQRQLEKITPGVEVDSHERWVAAFSQFSAVLQWLLGTLAAILVAGLALMITFTSRASLKLHAKTVQLLHSIGAEDRYITRQFQQEAFKLMLRGTIPGSVIAGLIYGATGAYLASLQTAFLPALPFSAPHGAVLLLMPLACGAVAWLTARMSVVTQLRHSL